MRNNCAIIATTAECFAFMLRDKLREIDYKVVVANSNADLNDKLKTLYPRFVFIEHCFNGHDTDTLVQQARKRNGSLRIVVWTAAELKPSTAARFIVAGAESYFSIRDTDRNIETILCRISEGRRYCPDEVKAEIEKDSTYPVIGEELTRREIEIVKLSVAGQTNKQIGDCLDISIHTVKFHKANIYRKCGGHTPLDILRSGLVRGIINEDDFGQVTGKR
jgi:DNA-binding NarL/FixJ family response regulator